MPYEPLNEREVRILRGMIDEYENARLRRRFIRGLVEDGLGIGRALGGIIAAILVALQIWILIRGH